MRTLLWAIVVLLLAGVAAGQVTIAAAPPASLERGYSQAYNLDFDAAQQEFSTWQKQHPDDPLGPASEAAGLLFSELNRLGVLESQFFVKDSEFTGRPKLNPDPAVKKRFAAALQRAEQRAQQALGKDQKDTAALFAMALVYGLRADYAQLIEKRNLASLSYTKDGSAWAQKLLAVAPDYYDAYLATGFSKYVIGSLSAPMRWLLHFGGFSGDKGEGIRDLQLTAEHGHLLAPFARLLLAIAYLRQNDAGKARQLLMGLRDEFPDNPLFSRELARLDQAAAGK